MSADAPSIPSNYYIRTYSAANMLGLTTRRVEQMCEIGVFKTAHKPGFGKKAHWRILKSEVTAHVFNGHVRS